MTTPAVSKPTEKGVTSNTSHTVPGSSPASPLSSRSNPPHSQVVARRASGHWTHCCGCGCCCYCSCCDCCCCCCCETWRIRWRVASLPFLFCLSSPFLPFSVSLFLPTGSLRPSFRRGPVRPLAWLLARFCAVPWRCACVVRCQHGSTMRCATMSCVCSTRGTHHALNLRLLLAPPGPQLFSLAQFALPEHSLLSHSS